MRVEEIQIDGFGHLKDRQLTLTQGLVCVLGDNEAGKSTLLAFVRGILFGFTHVLSKEQREQMGVDGRSAAAFDPVEGGSKGGSVVLIVPEGETERRYRFTRTEVRKKDGDLSIIDLGRDQEHRGEDAERLRARLLAGVDATVFGTVFAIGLDELHAVKALDKDTVQGVLFAADAGIGAEVATEMEALGKTLEEHYKPRGQKPRVNTLKRELKDLDKEIRQAQDDVSAHRGDQETYDQIRKEISELEARCVEFAQEADRAETRTQARTILHRLDIEHRRRTAYADRVLPTTEDRERHAELKSTLQNARTAHDEAKETLAALRQERARITFDPADAAAALLLPSVEPQDLERLSWNAAEHRRLLAEQQAETGAYLAPEHRVELGRVGERIESLEQRVEATREQLEAAEERLKAAQQHALDEAVERRYRPLITHDLAALERMRQERAAAQETARGRTDSALDALGPMWDRDRLVKVPADHATEAQVVGSIGHEGTIATVRTPSWATIGVGLALMALGIVGLAGILMGPLAGAVLLLAGAAVVAVGLTGRKTQTQTASIAPQAERALAPYGLPATTTRDAFRGFMATLRDARDRLEAEQQTHKELHELDERLRTLAASLRNAAKELGLPTEGSTEGLQDLVRRRLDEGQENRATAKAESATCASRETDLKAARATLEDALRIRERILTRCGLPSDAAPGAVQETLARSEARDERAHKIHTLQGDAERYTRLERAFSAVQERRQAPMPGLDEFPQVFRSVAEACQRAATAAKEAARLDKSIEAAEQDLGRRAARLQSLGEDLDDFYARFGAKDGSGFADALTAADECAQIDAAIQNEERRLVDLEANDPTIRDDARAIPAEEDTRLLAGRDEELGRLRSRIEELRAAAEERFARLARVRDQDDLTLLLQQRDALRQEYEDAVRDWLRLGLTKKLLEKVREKYEREHGPRVLQEAGRLLARITDGRYDGVGREPNGNYVLTRPDGRRILAVPPMVSRATFAQVYLAIRLAYAEVHDGHGVPYLLDDVLSDFDDGRLKRAVSVLAELAERRQIVLFTHHGHVADAVTDGGLPVTRLQGPPAVTSTMK